MRHATLRLLLGARRRLAKFSLGGDFSVTYLNRDERPCSIHHEYLGEYTPGSSIIAFDFRSESDRGHYFNSRGVYLLEDVIIEPIQGLVYDHTGSLLAESTIWPLFQLFNSFPWRPRIVSSILDVGESILITSNAYGHWLAEDLGSIIYLVNKYPHAKILFWKGAPKFVREFIGLLNRESIEVDGPIRIRQLLFVAKSQDSGWVHPRDVHEIRNFEPFKKALEIQGSSTSIYASRRNTARSPKNEDKIEQQFMEFGFEIVRLDELNFLDEIALLGKTKLFAGVHGSAHVNSIFIPEESKLLDIVNENYWTEMGPRIADIRNQTYIPIVFPGKPTDAVDLDLINQGIRRLIT
jgi:hypothetical protein